jgi:hypothetical protein
MFNERLEIEGDREAEVRAELERDEAWEGFPEDMGVLTEGDVEDWGDDYTYEDAVRDFYLDPRD